MGLPFVGKKIGPENKEKINPALNYKSENSIFRTKFEFQNRKKKYGSAKEEKKP